MRFGCVFQSSCRAFANRILSGVRVYLRVNYQDADWLRPCPIHASRPENRQADDFVGNQGAGAWNASGPRRFTAKRRRRPALFRAVDPGARTFGVASWCESLSFKRQDRLSGGQCGVQVGTLEIMSNRPKTRCSNCGKYAQSLHAARLGYGTHVRPMEWVAAGEYAIV